MRRLFTISCRIGGLVFVSLGALVLVAQSTEWWAYGDWNAVSVGYVLGYFGIVLPRLISLVPGVLDLPASAVLFSLAILIVAFGEGINLRKSQ